MIIRGVYNLSPPSLSNHQYCELQLDSAGKLKVSGTFTADTTLLASETTLSTLNGKIATAQILSTLESGLARTTSMGQVGAVLYGLGNDNKYYPLMCQGDNGALDVNISNVGFGNLPVEIVATDPLPTIEERTVSSTVSSVASSATNVTLLTSNANRRMALFYNDSAQVCYVKIGSAAASSTSFSKKMAAGEFFSVPFPICTGIIDAIWASADGSMRVTSW